MLAGVVECGSSPTISKLRVCVSPFGDVDEAAVGQERGCRAASEQREPQAEHRLVGSRRLADGAVSAVNA